MTGGLFIRLMSLPLAFALILVSWGGLERTVMIFLINCFVFYTLTLCYLPYCWPTDLRKYLHRLVNSLWILLPRTNSLSALFVVPRASIELVISHYLAIPSESFCDLLYYVVCFLWYPSPVLSYDASFETASYILAYNTSFLYCHLSHAIFLLCIAIATVLHIM